MSSRYWFEYHPLQPLLARQLTRCSSDRSAITLVSMMVTMTMVMVMMMSRCNHPCLLGKARLHDGNSGKSCATPAMPLIIDG